MLIATLIATLVSADEHVPGLPADSRQGHPR